ncbi:MAG: quinone oxidoreductase family protein [Gaiellales bacterium]
MRAVRQHAYGEPLVVEEVDAPVAGEGETLVTVARGSINPLDVWIANGAVAAAGPLPRTPGCEGVGTAADGSRVAFRGAGLGLVRDGAWAEQVAVPNVALAAIPDGCSDAQAAALGIPGVTAFDCLELAEVGAGSTVLILGASGGVSTIAMQLARAHGARVIAQTSSPNRVGQVSRYADEVVVAAADAIEAEVREIAPDGVDAILDPLAGAFSEPCIRLLAAKGVLVLYGASAGPSFSFGPQEMYRKNARVVGYSGLPVAPEATARSMEALFALVAAGTLEAVIADELPLEHVNEAVQRIKDNRAGGKLLLTP